MSNGRPNRITVATIALVFSSFLYFTPGHAQEMSPYERDAQAAKAYSTAYIEKDIEAFSRYLANDAVFEDPANYFVGKEAVLKGLSDVFSRVTRAGPDGREISKFRSGNHFLYSAWLDIFMMLPDKDEVLREFNLKLHFSMAIKVENGKVVHHVDYIDTEAFFRQVQMQQQ